MMKAWLQNFHNPFKKVKNIGFHKKPNPGTLQSAHIGFRNTHISKDHGILSSDALLHNSMTRVFLYQRFEVM